jgi:hypothetical protein
VNEIELIPCPRGGCTFYASLELRVDDALMHSLCPQGHDIALGRTVLEHLRTLARAQRIER